MSPIHGRPFFRSAGISFLVRPCGSFDAPGSWPVHSSLACGAPLSGAGHSISSFDTSASSIVHRSSSAVHQALSSIAPTGPGGASTLPAVASGRQADAPVRPGASCQQPPGHGSGFADARVPAIPHPTTRSGAPRCSGDEAIFFRRAIRDSVDASTRAAIDVRLLFRAAMSSSRRALSRRTVHASCDRR